MNSCILIPSYRPDESLPATVKAVKNGGFDKIVIVDDGSGPDYAPIFERAAADPAVTLVRHPVNMGKGRALKTGFGVILDRFPGCSAVAVDGDGQHPVEAAVRAAELAEETPDALILGCRDFAKQTAMPLPNRIGNLSVRAAFRLLTGVRFTDTQCGLRAYPPKVMRRLCDVSGDRFEFESNTLLAVRSESIPVTEFEMQVHYEPMENYVTTYRKGADTARIARILTGFALTPLLIGLLTGLAILCIAARGYGALFCGIAAGACVLIGKLLLAACSRKKAACAVLGVGQAIVYGVCFGLLCCWMAPGAAFAILAIPAALAFFASYRRVNYGPAVRILYR